MSNIHPQKYHITLSSFKSLTYQFHVIANDVTVELCQKYYSNEKLRVLLNDDDIKLLWKTRILFDESKEDFIEKARLKSLNMNLLFDTNTTPKYHKNSDCESLKNNYINFEIPPEIKFRGDGEILRLKKFANEHKELLREDESKFIDKLTAQFFLANPPRKLEYVNSGRYEFSELSVEEVYAKSIELTKKAVDLMNNNRDVYNKRYKPARLLKNDSEELTYWLKNLKPKLMEALYQYGIKKFGPSDFSFEKSFLEKFCFEPCRLCLKEKIIEKKDKVD
ncbi:hypothetical protein HA51_08520 [Pantoea rwandensis]|uniref:Uncharacterized protein n=2 Tax=Pantoea rwandensis TaxID=1076550 RepID=A0A1X1D034_9GAMM|nr:hypothetical protein HA51_08520 [Pantoea rwandensis]